MEIDTGRCATRRRHFLAGVVALAVARRSIAAPARSAVLVAAWDDAQGGHHIGLLQIDGDAVRIVASLGVPTRAHGLACAADGTVLAVARRPGEWLLRWKPGAAAQPEWVWAEAERRFNGHVLLAPDGQSIYTTEIELGSGEGQLVRRDAASLVETAVWPTHGLDPHDMEWLPDHRLLVANGGIQTLPETGRSKRALDRMDSSLVCIDSFTGSVNGQWRLADPRLSIRHLARHASGVVGVALQAEHEDLAERAAAPVLALFDVAARDLQAVSAVRSASGYGGDIAALQDGWLLSCPREHRVQHLLAQGRALSAVSLESACAIATDPAMQHAWMLGRSALRRDGDTDPVSVLAAGEQFDNHALMLPGPRRQAIAG